MRIGIYDRFWSTAGGGERVAAGMAEALAGDHDVELIGYEPVDLADLSGRLNVDLSGVGVRVVPEEPRSVEWASGDYDVFVNATYTSATRNRADRGIYYVHFPSPLGGPPRWLEAVLRGVGPLVRLGEGGSVVVDRRSGFHSTESLLWREGAWTSGEAVVGVSLPVGRRSRVGVDVARIMPEGRDHVGVEVAVDGGAPTTLDVTPVASKLHRRIATAWVDVVGRGADDPVEIRIRTDHRVKAGSRRIGAAIVGIRVGRGLRSRLRAWYPSTFDDRPRTAFLDSYDSVLSNSEYTATFVRDMWHRDSEVLHPPVTSYRAGEKRPVILSVGRFFAAESGHSKKQLELVDGFRRLLAGGVSGWELHLAGGVDSDGRDYFEAVTDAADGLPVVLHPNATGDELAELYAMASIYWHATGLGEDPRAHPDRFEHFGITTVEAMSAGAVPVVIGAAGQLETVQHGVTGYHWTSLDQLVGLTAGLVDDEVRRLELSDAARDAARRDSPERFRSRFRKHVS